MSRVSAASTQQYLPLAGIQDSVVIMNDGSLRAILKIEPINFDLKSETEQNSIIFGYQGFLNSLDFPIQIVIHSKKLDLNRYLNQLDATKKGMTNDLLRMQTEDYVDFLRRLISIANIMSKRFYVVVNYASSSAASMTTSLASIFSKKASGPLMDQAQFDRYREQIFERANLVAGGLSRLGVKVTLLETQQLIELFYGIYNPDIVSEQRIPEVSNLNAGVVSAPGVSQDPAVMNPTPIELPESPLVEPAVMTMPVEAPEIPLPPAVTTQETVPTTPPTKPQ
jgi:hypothetical protein